MEDDDRRDRDEGMSMGKVVAGAALGVAVPAAVGVARKLMASGENAGDDRSMSRPTSPARSQPRKRSSASRPKSPSGAARSGPTRTREQLYRQATRLKIEGRSSMNKAQLERAIKRAKSK